LLCARVLQKRFDEHYECNHYEFIKMQNFSGVLIEIGPYRA